MSEPTAASPNSARILIVDDDAMNRDVLSRRLLGQGYDVAMAANGVEALAAVRSEPFDLVLLDIMMPEKDGYEVLAELKGDDALRHIPVIMISALDQMNSIIRGIEMGADDFLPKPFDRTLLNARIGACLAKKAAHDREAHLFGQLKQNYKRLQELERLRDDLTHMIVHDLRTPLSSLISGIQTVSLMGGLNADQAEVMAIAIGGGNTLLAMINGLLDVDKMESGSLALDYTLLDPAELVEAAVAQVTQLFKDRRLSLVQEIEAGLPALQADENMLLRALVNLLGNAIKFTPEGGTVTVSVRKSEGGSSLTFGVSDTGEGIPAEAFEQIFEKFGQVESRQRGRTMSTGLGLTFCKLAVEAHGGEIDVESTPGQGSTFCFTVPLAPPVKAAA